MMMAPVKRPAARPAQQRNGQDLTQGDYMAMGAFRSALRRFLAFSEAKALEAGLTAQQHQALLAIKAHVGREPLTIGELADCLIIKNHSAVGLVGRLVDRGLAVREPSELDRRRVVLRITPAAEKLVEAVTRQNLQELGSSAVVIKDLLSTLKRIDRV
jgi:DNA-binding MarR family transcriptional regulator